MSKLITFYKGYIIPTLQSHLPNVSTNDLDAVLKTYAGFEGVSCKDMSNEDLNELIIGCFEFGDRYGIYLNFPDNEAEFIKDLI